MKLTVNDLVNHMQKHKDAVVIFGPAAGITNENVPTREQMEKFYTHKSLKRTPEKFWELFSNNIYVNPETEPTQAMRSISTLDLMGLTGAIVDQTTSGIYRLRYRSSNLIELHGDSAIFSCSSCKIEYPYMYYESVNTPCPNCEVCGKPLCPDVLLFGEKYKDERYEALKHHLSVTHTVILVGMDYLEDPIVSLISDYAAIKSAAIESGIEDDKRMLVVIGTPEDYDPNEMIGFCEFIVKDDPNAAMARLMSAFK
jgi:NAD-dependent SIR2 family protein deacetylase